MALPHNTSYKLTRSQGTTLNVLLVVFMILSVTWFALEANDIKYPMEPIVVLVGGLATLLASYWPFKPSYSDKRCKGRLAGNYRNNNGRFSIGDGDLAFTVEFGHHDGTAIYMYSHPNDIEAIADAREAGNFRDVKDCSVFAYGNRYLVPKEGQIISLKNVNGNYALVQVVDVRAVSVGDDRDEVTFAYVINPNGETDFS